MRVPSIKLNNFVLQSFLLVCSGFKIIGKNDGHLSLSRVVRSLFNRRRTTNDHGKREGVIRRSGRATRTSVVDFDRLCRQWGNLERNFNDQSWLGLFKESNFDKHSRNPTDNWHIYDQLDWVCGRDYLISTAQAIFFCGSIVGGFLFGWIADQKGRIPALMLCNGIGLMATVITASAKNFWFFAISRFLTGLAFDNCINIPLVIGKWFL